MKRRRTENCQNCGYSLNDEYNFCPRCGQENNVRIISFRSLIKETVQNYFSLDSRFGKSIKPFLFRPGFLTKEFVNGKRVSYANPIRLYLVLSLFFFFALSFWVEQVGGDARGQSPIWITKDEKEKRELGEDATLIERASGAVDWDLVDSLRFDSRYSESQLIDSMDLPETGFLERKLRFQIVRLYRTDTFTFQKFLIGNLPLMMIFVIPIMGWWLRVFFGFRTLYITHLIHAIHIHSFAYLLYGLAFLLALLFGLGQKPIIPAIMAIFVVTIYSLVSLKFMYNNTWFQTILRALPLGFLYAISFIIFLLIEILISLLLF